VWKASITNQSPFTVPKTNSQFNVRTKVRTYSRVWYRYAHTKFEPFHESSLERGGLYSAASVSKKSYTIYDLWALYIQVTCFTKLHLNWRLSVHLGADYDHIYFRNLNVITNTLLGISYKSEVRYFLWPKKIYLTSLKSEKGTDSARFQTNVSQSTPWLRLRFSLSPSWHGNLHR
jgi:hypothetical protein